MSLENCRLKEISDKYWNVAESIFGFTESIDSFKLLLNESNENNDELSNCHFMKAENAALNFELFDVLNDGSRDGLVSLPNDFMIKINNKILVEDYNEALSITMNGIAHYGSYRELLDLKRILERKCTIYSGMLNNGISKPSLTITKSSKKNARTNTSSSSESEYSNESKSRTISSSSSSVSNQTSDFSNLSSSNEDDETTTYCSSSSAASTTNVSVRSSIIEVDTGSKSVFIEESTNTSLIEDSLSTSLKPITKLESDLDDTDDDEEDVFNVTETLSEEEEEDVDEEDKEKDDTESSEMDNPDDEDDEDNESTSSSESSSDLDEDD